jgi:hypothetical protein
MRRHDSCGVSYIFSEVVRMKWLADKEKNGERFTNSECLSYCLKCFRKEKRVELWHAGQGYEFDCSSEAEALFLFRVIKGIGHEQGISQIVAARGRRIANSPL